MLRAVTLALLLLAGCEYAYGVQRRVDAPEGCRFSALQEALEQEPGFWSREEGFCLVGEGDAPAIVSIDDRSLYVGSVWINRLPTPGELQKSMDLHLHLIRRMRAAVPEVPGEEAWAIEWINMDAPLDELAR